MMKRFQILLFVIVLVSADEHYLAPAQTAPADGAEHGLQVIRFNWDKYRPSRLSLDTGQPGADVGPAERAEDMRLSRQILVERRRDPQNRSHQIEKLEERRSRRHRRLPDSNTGMKPLGMPSGSGGYRYTVEVQNGAAKKVTAIEWDYLFVDPVSNKEMLRHSFISKKGIDPGKRKKVEVTTDLGPYGLVDARVVSGDLASEKVAIKRVVYADGSVWHR